MREIKFRAWTGAKLEYDVVVGRFGAFYGAGLDPKDSASFTPYNTIYHKSTPIMQYTGLKDKNGVEIYEGDVIEYKGKTDAMHIGRVRSVVYWYESKDGFYPMVGWYSQSDDEVEIIGNIWENGDLLK